MRGLEVQVVSLSVVWFFPAERKRTFSHHVILSFNCMNGLGLDVFASSIGEQLLMTFVFLHVCVSPFDFCRAPL